MKNKILILVMVLCLNILIFSMKSENRFKPNPEDINRRHLREAELEALLMATPEQRSQMRKKGVMAILNDPVYREMRKLGLDPSNEADTEKFHEIKRRENYIKYLESRGQQS